MKKKMERIDVIVPCYNYARFLGSCVESVLSQSQVDVRLLIIDDCSSDDTASVASTLASQDKRIQFRRHRTNVGNIDTYNEGIDWATADYLLILSADDYLLPGSLLRAASVLAAHPEVVLTCGHAAVAYEDKVSPSIPPQGDMANYRVMTGQDFIMAVCANSSHNPIWTPTAVVRTAAQQRVGGYSKTLPHAGDLHMWLRLARIGSVAILDCYQAVYRRHGSNMHNSYAGVPNLRQHLLAFESALAGDSSVTNTQAAMQYKRGLAMGAIRSANHALNEKDPKGFDESVSFALEVCPSIRHTMAWRAMQLRKLLGFRIVNALRKAVRPVLGIVRSKLSRGIGVTPR